MKAPDPNSPSPMQAALHYLLYGNMDHRAVWPEHQTQEQAEHLRQRPAWVRALLPEHPDKEQIEHLRARSAWVKRQIDEMLDTISAGVSD